MKKYIFNLFVIFAFCSALSAQDKDRKETIKSLKIGYLTKELDLTIEEAEKFWPVYNSHQRNIYNSRNIIMKKFNSKLEAKKNYNSLSESEAKKLVEKDLDASEKVYIERKKFLKKLTSIISYKKILKLQIAERDFGRKVMRKFRGRK